MGGESASNKLTTPVGAVFLSYASQDAEAAKRICDALRAAGIEVWFDQSELRGGDAWDRSIRDRIHDCQLFIAVISAHTEARDEGYFRREWSLAVDRTRDMDEKKPFLVPVVIDDTSKRAARVPEKFHGIQWTRLPAGTTPREFVRRIGQLLAGEAKPAVQLAREPSAVATGGSPRFKPVWLAVAVVVASVAAYLSIEKPWTPKPGAPPVFAPPPHSIAVLPFANMSGDKEQEYFSDGLTEELLNSLAEINELQVAGRTSSFYFKGKDVDLGTVARKLNVGAVLEGSVRRSGNTVRITTQLINAVTGFHLWSHSYDRDLGDVLKLESEIAGSVAGALKVNLLGNLAAKVELGGTRNPTAFDAYLRGAKAFNESVPNAERLQAALTSFTEAIALDGNYARAFGGRSLALVDYATYFATGAAMREGFDKALADARHAVALAPELPESQLALAQFFAYGALDFTQASEAWERTMSLAPGDARILGEYGLFAVQVGRPGQGLAAARRAVVLDPLGARSHFRLGQSLYLAHHYRESVTAYNDALALEPEAVDTYGWRGLAYYALADFDSARSSCESKADAWESLWCLSIVYDKLGRHADAEAVLAKLEALDGDADAYQYAGIYAQWGGTSKAVEWLETALRVRDPGLSDVRVDPLLDPLRNEPRYQVVMRELKFP